MKIILAAFAVLLLGSAPGWAVLGEYENSIATDQQQLHAQLYETAGVGYSIKELRSTDGGTVREYVSATGLVFGIAWQGPTMPDLRQLLGSYFGQLQQAAQSRRKRGGPLIIQSSGFVFESAGHMRSFHGRAYVPGLVPYGAPAAVVQ